jgi:hypothetical protein
MLYFGLLSLVYEPTSSLYVLILVHTMKRRQGVYGVSLVIGKRHGTSFPLGCT